MWELVEKVLWVEPLLLSAFYQAPLPLITTQPPTHPQNSDSGQRGDMERGLDMDMELLVICVAHTFWAPKGHERRSQEGLKGTKPASTGPSLLIISLIPPSNQFRKIVGPKYLFFPHIYGRLPLSLKRELIINISPPPFVPQSRTCPAKMVLQKYCSIWARDKLSWPCSWKYYSTQRLGDEEGFVYIRFFFLGLQSLLSVLTIPSTHCIGGDGNGDQVGGGDVVWRCWWLCLILRLKQHLRVNGADEVAAPAQRLINCSKKIKNFQ